MVEARDIELSMKQTIDWEHFRDKTILITGATGRLGMYFVEVLLKADIDWNLNLEVIALARNKKKIKEVFGDSLHLPNLKILEQDIRNSIKWEGNVDYIIHTAGPASPQDFTYSPVETLWSHVSGTHNVLELARQKKSTKVLYVSTVEVYGTFDGDAAIKEDDMGALKCDTARACYSEAKRLCEAMLASYEAEYNISYVCARLSHTFGPGISLEDGRAFAEFIACVIKGEDIVLHTDGSAVRTYTYVTDAIGAMMMILTRGTEHYYNIANVENQISIRDLAELIVRLDPKKKSKVCFATAQEQKLKYLPFKLGIMDVNRVCMLGWKPHVGLEDAFRYTIESFLQKDELWN